MKLSEWISENKYLFHVTTEKKLSLIKKFGIKPSIPKDMPNETKAVFLFKTYDDVEDAIGSWLDYRFDEDDKVITLKLDASKIKNIEDKGVGYEVFTQETIPFSAIIDVISEE